MKSWKNSRNYRRFKDENGKFVNVIRIGGEAVEVSDDVFKAYSRTDRRERYEEGDKASKKPVVLDASGMESAFAQEGLYAPGAEDAFMKSELSKSLHAALDALKPEDRALIEAVYGGMSERKYARSVDKSQSAVRKRRQRILRDLKQALEEAGF